MQHLELIFPPPPQGYDIHLATPINVLIAWSAEKTDPVLFLDESTMQWCVLDMHISEVACARKED